MLNRNSIQAPAFIQKIHNAVVIAHCAAPKSKTGVAKVTNRAGRISMFVIARRNTLGGVINFEFFAPGSGYVTDLVKDILREHALKQLLENRHGA